jgi:hypothetical protein
MCLKILLVVIFLLFIGCGQQQASTQPNAAAQRHLEEIRNAPPGTFHRTLLERGWHGDGIHEPWMDDMRKQNVKGAMFEVHGTWLLPFGFIRPNVTRIMYFGKYAGPNAQITDARWLEKIRSSGLEKELEKVALRRADRASRLLHSTPLTCKDCFAQVRLVDDEWLMWNHISLVEYDASMTPLDQASVVDDEASLGQLLGENHRQRDLDRALFAAVGPSWDTTGAINLILKAGANVNTRKEDGSTPLMDAVRANDLQAATLLMAAGANPNIKDGSGNTALSIASCSRCPEYVNAATTGQLELIQLLKNAGARE